MKQQKHWTVSITAAVVSLLVTLPPSFVATDDVRVVFEFGTVRQWLGLHEPIARSNAGAPAVFMEFDRQSGRPSAR